jgi:Protein of unknown function (DUF1353)
MRWRNPNILLLIPFITIPLLAGCAGVSIPEPGEGRLKGRVFVEWDRQDAFIYRKTKNPVSFTPSFINEPIVPGDMYTDGGSVPRIFWNILGLSPWALGPAYIVHDWIFKVHRCDLDAPAHVKAITFEQSASILAEVGRSLVDAGLVDDDRLPEIVWAIKSRYARNIWESPGSGKDCAEPPTLQELRIAKGAAAQFQTVVDFEIPPPRRR